MLILNCYLQFFASSVQYARLASKYFTCFNCVFFYFVQNTCELIVTLFFKHGIQNARTYADENKEEEENCRYRSLAIYYISSHYCIFVIIPFEIIRGRTCCDYYVIRESCVSLTAMRLCVDEF